MSSPATTSSRAAGTPFDRWRAPLIAFLLGLAVYGATSGALLAHQSPAPHFVLQADAWLHGRADIADWPPYADDQARVEEVQLDSGQVVRGRRLFSQGTFRIAGGTEVPLVRVTRSLRTITYVSFPGFPSVLMLPQVLISGRAANDVWTTVVLAALVPAIFVLLLRRLRAAGLSYRTPAEDTWLTALLSVGTVFYYASIMGRVWFTAHVAGVLLASLYALLSIEAANPLAAGAALGCAFLTRTPMLFMFPLFLAEAWRMAEGDRAAFVRRVARFAAPILVVGLAAAAYNWVRFHEPTEFGHSYLAVRQQAQIERYGLFSLHYLARNLAVAFTLLPELSTRAPHVTIGGHGLAIWVTTPALLLVLWPREKGPLHRPLWITVAMLAVWSLLYQNSGWVQFGYRFSLDYMVFLVLLLAVGARPLGRVAKGLIVLGILVNLFGAVTFARVPRFYRTDPPIYDCVTPN